MDKSIERQFKLWIKRRGVGRAANKRFLSDSACMYDNCIKLYNEMYSEYKSLGYDDNEARCNAFRATSYQYEICYGRKSGVN